MAQKRDRRGRYAGSTSTFQGVFGSMSHRALGPQFSHEVFSGVDANAPNYWEDTHPLGHITLHPDDDVIATQKELDPQHPAWLGRKLGGPEPSVVSSEGSYYVSDGHHRIGQARRTGQSIRVQNHGVSE